MHPMECRQDAGSFISHFTILRAAEYPESNVVKSTGSWEMLEQLLSEMSFVTPAAWPLARSAVAAWPDDVKMSLTVTNKKMLPVDVRNASILKFCSCSVENTPVRFVLKYVCFS